MKVSCFPKFSLPPFLCLKLHQCGLGRTGKQQFLARETSVLFTITKINETVESVFMSIFYHSTVIYLWYKYSMPFCFNIFIYLNTWVQIYYFSFDLETEIPTLGLKTDQHFFSSCCVNTESRPWSFKDLQVPLL